MDKISRKNYVISVLLVLAILSAAWLLRLYIIPVPKDQSVFVISIDLRLFAFCIVIGIVADVVFLLAKKPIFLAVIAIIAIFTCLLCNGALFTALYAIAVLCLLGSIPFVASMIGKMKQNA